MPEDEAFLERCKLDAERGRSTGLAALTIAAPIFAGEKLCSDSAVTYVHPTERMSKLTIRCGKQSAR